MSEKMESYPRFRLIARIEHIILLLSFTILAVTGLPQKYPGAGFSESLISWLGGIETTRIIHRVSAFVLTVGSVYHLFTSTYRGLVLRERNRMLPDFKDVTDLWETLKHNLGFQKHPPKMRKFNFGEKVEYWAVVWGTAIMALTGFILWNPIATAKVLPGQFIPAALAAHGGEAVLAVLSILIWHLYNVLIKHRNFSMFTGDLPHHQMEEEHALELERIEKGIPDAPAIPPDVLRRRQRIFMVAGIVVGTLMVGIVIWAATFEETALETIPRITREAFTPLLTPVP